MQIKAQAFLYGTEWVLKTHGERVLSRILASCGPTVRERYMTAIAIEWHEGAELEEFLRVTERHLGAPPGSVAREIGAAGASHNMKGFMRRLGFYAARQDYALARVGAAWRQFNDEGEMTLKIEKEGACVMRVTDADLPGPLFCETLTGWCGVLGEHVGMRSPHVVHEKCRFRGEDCCSWEIRWKPEQVVS